MDGQAILLRDCEDDGLDKVQNQRGNLVNLDWDLVDLGLDQETHTFWSSEDTFDKTFENNHGCWYLLGTIKQLF